MNPRRRGEDVQASLHQPAKDLRYFLEAFRFSFRVTIKSKVKPRAADDRQTVASPTYGVGVSLFDEPDTVMLPQPARPSVSAMTRVDSCNVRYRLERPPEMG